MTTRRIIFWLLVPSGLRLAAPLTMLCSLAPPWSALPRPSAKEKNVSAAIDQAERYATRISAGTDFAFRGSCRYTETAKTSIVAGLMPPRSDFK
jgi:hypothetical protein